MKKYILILLILTSCNVKKNKQILNRETETTVNENLKTKDISQNEKKEIETETISETVTNFNFSGGVKIKTPDGKLIDLPTGKGSMTQTTQTKSSEKLASEFNLKLSEVERELTEVKKENERLKTKDVDRTSYWWIWLLVGFGAGWWVKSRVEK